jgi:hypothetical protein
MLKNFVAVYVPSTIDVSVQASAELIQKVTAQVAAKLAGRFGGATQTTANGYWIADNGDLVREDINIVKAFYDDDDGALNYAIEIAAEIKATLSQEAVTVETNDGIQFV